MVIRSGEVTQTPHELMPTARPGNAVKIANSIRPVAAEVLRNLDAVDWLMCRRVVALEQS